MVAVTSGGSSGSAEGRRPLSAMTDPLSVDTSSKIAVNAVDLLNRDELSPSQNRELQRYIDAHSHLLHYKDRDLPPEPPVRNKSQSNYARLSGRLGSNAPPAHDNGHGLPPRINSRSVSPEKRYGNGHGRSGSASPYSTIPRHLDDDYGTYSSLRHNQLSSPNADSLKRKGVSWSDLVGVGGEPQSRVHQHSQQQHHRQISPTPPPLPLHNSHSHYDSHARDGAMSQYGSAGNVSREYNMSPAYSTLGKSRDNYNRFETESHVNAKRSARSREEEERSRFKGYGDRPGSGVELSGHHWQGGEIVSDPNHLPKSLKPRRIYYSPIGDGVVAADGVELKRLPKDLNPKVTVTQLTHVERGRPGHDGLNEYIKSWTAAGSAPASEHGYGSEYGPGAGGPGSGRGLGALSPDGSKGLGNAAGLGNSVGGPHGNGLRAGGPGSGGYPGGDPYGHGNRGSPFEASRDHNGPDNTGRMSTASSMFSDPGYKYTDIKHGYAITNPRELIHQYATTTPVAVMDTVDNTPTTTTATYRKKVTTRIEEREGSNYPPYRSASSNVASSTTITPPGKFVKQLRDDTMTTTQREANTHLDPLNNRDPNQTQRVQDIRYKTSTARGNDEIDSLTDKLVQGLGTTPTPSRY